MKTTLSSILSHGSISNLPVIMVACLFWQTHHTLLQGQIHLKNFCNVPDLLRVSVTISLSNCNDIIGGCAQKEAIRHTRTQDPTHNFLRSHRWQKTAYKTSKRPIKHLVYPTKQAWCKTTFVPSIFNNKQ